MFSWVLASGLFLSLVVLLLSQSVILGMVAGAGSVLVVGLSRHWIGKASLGEVFISAFGVAIVTSLIASVVVA